MPLHRCRRLLLVLALAGGWHVRAEAQTTIREELVDKFNALMPLDHSRPLTVHELCCRLDCLAEELRDTGLVLVKQPDVFSQARLTRFRNDVDAQMSTDLANFHLVLAARINRLDSATTQSATSLGAALAAPGTTNVAAPSAGNTSAAATLLNPSTGVFPASSGGPPTLFGSGGLLTQGAFGTLTTGPSALPSATTTAALTLGLEPTVYLEEKKRFLDYLNHIRRLNLGPDQNDSSGYGLYLIRMPVSIAPGECTYQGHGAELGVQVEHEFTPDFLPSAFRRLVINDVVDQLGPFIYEAIRSGFYDKYLVTRHNARQVQHALRLPLAEMIAERTSHLNPDDAEDIAQKLTNFVLRTGLPWTTDASKNQGFAQSIQYRRQAVMHYAHGEAAADRVLALRANVRGESVGQGKDLLLRSDGEVSNTTRKDIRGIISPPGLWNPSNPTFREFLQRLYEVALDDDVHLLDDLLGVAPKIRPQISRALVQARKTMVTSSTQGLMNINLPSSRTAKQSYPINPRDYLAFFGEENLYLIAHEVVEASRSPEAKIRSSEIRDYMRHLLEAAYSVMARAPDEAGVSEPVLADDGFMKLLIDSIRERNFASKGEQTSSREYTRSSLHLEKLMELMNTRLEGLRGNLEGQPIGALCWAIAVDAALLDAALLEDARKVFTDKGLPSDCLEGIHFYHPGNPDEQTHEAFCQYVRQRWPIITFAIEPVTDQQNIADSFSLNRDLQLAVSFAFATGQINFSQLDSFRRQIQQSADTIALNRTITGFLQGQDTFGFRFTPRFQNPPNQKTNIGVITSQLISGGPGPNYQTRKSRLEPGVREINAILLVPTFLPVLRMNLASNWFKLTDPEHLVFHTGKMMERGRKVQELREAVSALCNAHLYRDADLRVLRSKMNQLDTMLPMQSTAIQLPFENSAAGFDLLSQGSAALVPELTGYSGVDIITAPAQPTPAAGGSSAGGSAAAQGATPATFSVTTLTTSSTPTNTAMYTITGGTTSIADVFVFGKYISLLDTRVIAGGKVASFEILSREVIHVQIPSGAIPTTTEDNQTYIEVYLATPNGISNSLLIPYQATVPTPPAKIAYSLAASAAVDVYYQWLPGPDGKPTLVPAANPSNSAITITWDTPTGLAPRQIQVQLSATSNGQNIVLLLQATPDTKGDYVIDGTEFTRQLLDRIKTMTVFPALPATPLSFTVTVQPWIPNDSQGLRAETTPKTLASQLTVNLQYNATGAEAWPAPASSTRPGVGGGGASSRLMAPALPGDPRLASARDNRDPALLRTAQQVPLALPQLPALPQSAASAFLNATQPPPPLARPALLGPNVASEAEQVSKMLTGQPVATTISGLTPPGTPAFSLPGLPTSGPSPLPTILVNPSPVTVISPAPTDPKRKKHTSRIHQMFNRLGNRASQTVPQ